MTNLNKGDLVRVRVGHPCCKGLVIGNYSGASKYVKVLWVAGYWKGERAWIVRDYLDKIEVESV